MSEQTQTQSKCEVLEIPEADGLDAVVVYWRNFQPGKGSVVLTCWGSAWACYFGGMGAESIQEFFASADTPYLVSKMGFTRHLIQTKRNAAYLARVIDAVKKSLGGAA